MVIKMYRVEDKYCCSAGEMYQLQQRLGTVLQTDFNESSGDGYHVISLYFDDLADSCLKDTEDGIYSRCKYRIRIYNDTLDIIKLEIKEKQGSRVNKKSKCITEEEMYRLMRGQCIPASFSPDDPAFLFNLAIQTKVLRPKIIVAYERKAYIYELGNVRITFDRNIRTSRQIEDFGTQKISYDPLRDINAVLEIKYDEFMPGFLLQLLELNCLQQTAYSKYQLCRERYE